MNEQANPLEGSTGLDSGMLESGGNLLLLAGIILVYQRSSEALSNIGLLLLVVAFLLTITALVMKRTPWQRLLERIAVFGMAVGILGMLQPWQIRLYENGFYVLGLSTLMFIVVSHIPVREE